MSIQFLTVDLEIESYDELQPLALAFGEEALELYCGPVKSHFRAVFEVAGDLRDPDSLIQRFCFLVESLDRAALGLWKRAFSRVFDIGYESGSDHTSFVSDIRPDTIEEVAKIGASIRVTIYPPSPRSPVEGPSDVA